MANLLATTMPVGIMIIIVSLSVFLAIAIGVIIYLLIKFKGSDVKVKDGVRYSANNQTKTNSTDVALGKKDILLQQDVDYTVGKDNLLAGNYTLISNNESKKDFNIRIGGIVRGYKHGEKIVLAKGETICAVSQSVILR